MANPEHLEILKQGVEQWNKWRKAHPTVLPDLSEAKHHGFFWPLNLCRADFSRADFTKAYLGAATLRWANLREADLRNADLRDTHVDEADFTGAVVGGTNFAGVDLSAAKGLETVTHYFPSIIGIDTIYKSQGKIPEIFLRGCGVPDEFIAYIGSMVGRPIEFYSCFISYSTRDQEFADRLYADEPPPCPHCNRDHGR